MRMLEVEILGVKLSADLLNPDVAERYECGYNHAIERMKKCWLIRKLVRKESGSSVRR